jgi:hypothetical protein
VHALYALRAEAQVDTASKRRADLLGAGDAVSAGSDQKRRTRFQVGIPAPIPLDRRRARGARVSTLEFLHTLSGQAMLFPFQKSILASNTGYPTKLWKQLLSLGKLKRSKACSNTLYTRDINPYHSWYVLYALQGTCCGA